MMIVATLSFLQACLWATAGLPDEGSGGATFTVAPGDVVRLPCSSAGLLTPRSATWTKNGREVIRGGGQGPSPSTDGGRLSLLADGTLSIAEASPGDEGSYLCTATLRDNSTFRGHVRLRVNSHPENLTVTIYPASALSNGTLYVFWGSDVSFNCSTSSFSPRRLQWAFQGDAASNGSLAATTGPSLDFRIAAVEPGDQGVYTCRALGDDGEQEVTATASALLLVYYVSDRHLECTWAPAQDPSHVLFDCSWPGTYPAPALSWAEGRGQRVYASEVTDKLSLMLNHSGLTDGQRLTCTGRHVALALGTEKSCTFALKLPFPEGEPLAMAQEGESATLTCTEATSTPPANTTWRRGLRQDHVVPGLKYEVSEEGPVLRLTVHNVSREDEGVYFCRSENLLGVRELEVYLTVRTSSAYTGVIIGIFVAAVIVALAIMLAKSLYSNRHRICLGRDVRQEDGGDVMNLVESDDEQLFQDAVPRLPPLPDTRQTTLVQIHRIPSRDQDDPEGADPSPVQQEDPAQTEEPASLVTF